MKNIERLAKHITKHGNEGLLIHTLPESGAWVLCQKIEKNKWALSLERPEGTTKFNLGEISDKEHLILWEEIINTRIEKTTKEKEAKQFKNVIYNFKRRFKNFKKIYEINDKGTRKKIRRNRTPR